MMGVLSTNYIVQPFLQALLKAGASVEKISARPAMRRGGRRAGVLAIFRRKTAGISIDGGVG
jgi:hypothetical protein